MTLGADIYYLEVLVWYSYCCF